MERVTRRLPAGLDPDGAVADPARIALAERLDRPARDLEPTLDAVAAVAQGSLDGALAMVNLIDGQRQRVRGRAPLTSAAGTPPRLQAPPGLPVQETFCRYIVAARQVVMVDDLSADQLTSASPAAALGVRAYAGAPVVVDGAAVGTVCVVDDRPRRWTDEDGDVLQGLADDVAAQLRAAAR